MSELAEIEAIKSQLKAGTVGYSLLEKLVLALIDAHPILGKDGKPDPLKSARARNKRLSDAMLALRGDYYRHGKKDADDRLVLMWMASQYTRKHNYPKPIKLGSDVFLEDNVQVDFEDITNLAKRACEHFYGNAHSEESAIRRLQRKFMKDKEKLLMEARYANRQVHDLEHQTLLQIKEKLDIVGVPFELPEKPSAF